MFRTGIVLTLICGPLVAASRADIPLPPNMHYIDPFVRFDGLAKLPEYEFRLRFQTFTGGPSGIYTYRTVPDGKSFNLKCERRLIDMQLLGLKREEFDRRAKEDKSLQWLTDEVPGVLAAEVSPPSTVGKRGQPTPVSQYRVTLKDGVLQVEEIAVDRGGASFVSPWATWISGVALSFGAAGFGLWLSRRPRNAQIALQAGNSAV